MVRAFKTESCPDAARGGGVVCRRGDEDKFWKEEEKVLTKQSIKEEEEIVTKTYRTWYSTKQGTE